MTSGTTQTAINWVFSRTKSNKIFAIADQALSSLAQFTSGIIIGRTCSKEEFGLFTLGLTIILLLTGIQSALITSPYTCYFPRLKGPAQRTYSGSSLVHQFALSLIAMLLISIMGFLSFLGVMATDIAPVIWALFLTLTFIIFHQFVRFLLFAHMKFSTAIFVDAAVLIIEVAGLLLLASYRLLSAKSAYWIIGTATGIAGITWVVLNRREFSFKKSNIISDLRLNISFGKWILGSVVIYYLCTQGYYWLLSEMKSIAETGAFAACQGAVNIANPFLLGIYNVLRPEASESFTSGGISALKKVIKKALIVISIPMILFFFIILIKGNEIVVLIYGAKYRGMGIVATVLAINMFVMAISSPFDYGIWAMEKTDRNFFIILPGSIIVLLFGVGLIDRFGILGAALGLLGGNMIILFLRFIIFSKYCTSLKQ